MDSTAYKLYSTVLVPTWVSLQRPQSRSDANTLVFPPHPKVLHHPLTNQKASLSNNNNRSQPAMTFSIASFLSLAALWAVATTSACTVYVYPTASVTNTLMHSYNGGDVFCTFTYAMYDLPQKAMAQPVVRVQPTELLVGPPIRVQLCRGQPPVQRILDPTTPNRVLPGRTGPDHWKAQH